MSPDHLIQHLQQDAPDILQRLDPVIDHLYRTYLHDALDAPQALVCWSAIPSPKIEMRQGG